MPKKVIKKPVIKDDTNIVKTQENKNPILADLEVSQTSETISGEHKNSPVSDIAKAIEMILSEEHGDQKTNITEENEDGLICIDVLQAHMLRCFKYKFASLEALKQSKQEHALSVKGYRSEQIVEIFKSIQTQIITGDSPSIGKRLLGR
jgi:hypothetical protein